MDTAFTRVSTFLPGRQRCSDRGSYEYELLNPSYDSAKRWVALAAQWCLINPGKRKISVPGGGSTLTHHCALRRTVILASTTSRMHGNRLYLGSESADFQDHSD